MELWDGDQELRGYLRQGNPVFNAGGNVTVKTCRENQGILLPLLHKITGYGCKMPDVEPLRQALRDLYNKNGQPSVHYETIVKESWQIRMHLSQLKRKAKRGEVSKDCCSSIASMLDHFPAPPHHRCRTPWCKTCALS